MEIISSISKINRNLGVFYRFIIVASIIWIAVSGKLSYYYRTLDNNDSATTVEQSDLHRTHFEIKSSNGHTYSIDGPANGTSEQARAAITEQRLREAGFSDQEINTFLDKSAQKRKLSSYYFWLYVARDALGSLFCVYAILFVLSWVWNGRKVGKGADLISDGKQA